MKLGKCSNMDWQAMIFDPQENIFETLDKLAFKQFSDEIIAQEVVSVILKQWQDSDWAKLDKYQRRNSASPKTFLYSVFKNTLIDEYRKRYGRCEPPVWVKQLGDFWSNTRGARKLLFL